MMGAGLKVKDFRYTAFAAPGDRPVHESSGKRDVPNHHWVSRFAVDVHVQGIGAVIRRVDRCENEVWAGVGNGESVIGAPAIGNARLRGLIDHSVRRHKWTRDS